MENYSDNSPGEIEIPYVELRYKEVFSAHESLFLFSHPTFQCFFHLTLNLQHGLMEIFLLRRYTELTFFYFLSFHLPNFFNKGSVFIYISAYMAYPFHTATLTTSVLEETRT